VEGVRPTTQRQVHRPARRPARRCVELVSLTFTSATISTGGAKEGSAPHMLGAPSSENSMFWLRTPPPPMFPVCSTEGAVDPWFGPPKSTTSRESCAVSALLPEVGRSAVRRVSITCPNPVLCSTSGVSAVGGTHGGGGRELGDGNVVGVTVASLRTECHDHVGPNVPDVRDDSPNGGGGLDLIDAAVRVV
jgi:hypothetical protein